MRIVALAVALSFGLLVAGAADAKATQCKDAAGKFIKCPAAVAAPVAPSVSKPTVAPSSVGAPAGATAKCKDGTYSMSKTHSGACSHHGGVANWL